MVDEGQYSLVVYDALGNKVKTLFNGKLNTGTTPFEWNGLDDNGNSVGNGAYIYRLTGNNVSASRKLILSK
ncbi:MAG: T9SS type A sorting domain-containing protein [Ignavibacteriae bacterium]|nr:T9SS type A sorting domain-containing protein [Ignavibacteriota bacterium]